MLGKTLYFDYSYSGKGRPFHTVATDRMMIQFLPLDILSLTYFQQPEGLNLKIFDQLMYSKDYKLKYARRDFKDPDGNMISNTIEGLPRGTFFDAKGKESKELMMNADEQTRRVLLEQSERILAEIKERFLVPLQRRKSNADEAYPIDLLRFLGNDCRGNNALFSERFMIRKGFNGFKIFSVEAETEKYNLTFSYTENWRGKSGDSGELLDLDFFKNSAYGLRVSFDDNFQILRISDFFPNYGEYVANREDKKDSPFYRNVEQIVEEARRELNLDERLKDCRGLTDNELNWAEEVVAYMEAYEKAVDRSEPGKIPHKS